MVEATSSWSECIRSMPCSSRYGNSVARTSPDQAYSKRVMVSRPRTSQNSSEVPRTMRFRGLAAACTIKFVDHLVERLGSVDIYRSGRFLVAPIEREHEFDFLGLLAKFIIGALLEAATHSVIVDTEVEYLGEIGQKAVAITAASTNKQHFWFRAFELADSFLLVPH